MRMANEFWSKDDKKWIMRWETCLTSRKLCIQTGECSQHWSKWSWWTNTLGKWKWCSDAHVCHWNVHIIYFTIPLIYLICKLSSHSLPRNLISGHIMHWMVKKIGKYRFEVVVFLTSGIQNLLACPPQSWCQRSTPVRMQKYPESETYTIYILICMGHSRCPCFQ